MGLFERILVTSLVFYCVCAEGGGDESRALRDDFRQDQWRGVEKVQIDTSDWIPDSSQAEEPHLEIQLPKRRRIRKRKRRPQPIPLTDPEAEIIAEWTPPRRRRPTRLDESRDSWKEMEEESRTRPNKRRRIIPKYQDVQAFDEGTSTSLGFGQKGGVKLVDDDVSVLQADQGIRIIETIHPTTVVPDLKALLKQKGGLSLSEILQQKNLSLADLLKGEKQVISALIDKKPGETGAPVKYSSNYRLENTIKNINKLHDVHNESYNNLIDKENQTLGKDQSNKFDLNEETTPRIFVPSNSKFYTTVDYKPNILIDIRTPDKIKDDATTQDTKLESTTTTTIAPVTRSSPKFHLKHRLPVTSAKLNKNSPTHKNEVSAPTIPPKAFKINIDELFGLSIENETVKKEQGPLRMSFNLNELVDKTTVKLHTQSKPPTTEKFVELTTKLSVDLSTSTMKPIPDKVKPITAKDEIMEILKDSVAKENLSKILASRNMTIEELVELRERGSSQRHLADIFHNNTKEPEPSNEPHIGHVKSPGVPFKPFSYFDRKPKSSPLSMETGDFNSDNYVAPVSKENTDESNESKIEETKDKTKYTVTSFPTYKIEMDRTFKDNKSSLVPVVEPMYPIMHSDIYASTYHKGIVETLINNNNIDDIRPVDTIENAVADSANDQLNVDVNINHYAEENEDDGDIFLKIPYGVKSAIFASLSIVGISLVVFLTILVIFKWSQKHKQKLCYNNSFSCSKSKVPILENSQKRTFATIMNETLGRKKHYYKQHLQSMSDSIWENDKKPFQ